MNKTDQELMIEWKAGDREAGNELLSRHLAGMRRFFANKALNDQDVADLVAQTFLGCTSSLERLRNPAGFRSYLFGIACNVLRNYYRTRAKRKLELEDFDTVCLQSLNQRSASSLVMEQRRLQAFVDGLRDVPVNDQHILELRYFMGLSAKRIADMLEIPPATMRGQLMRARTRLRSRVEENLATASSEAVNLEAEHLESWSAEIRQALAMKFGEIAEEPAE